jgi:DNA-binding NarL/FixJ family response regulator
MRVVLVGPARERRRLREQLPAAVEVVAEYDTSEDASHANHGADVVVATSPDDQVEHLTPRESQVLALLAEGLSNKGIAERLAISDQTVKFHVASIMGKLGTTNRVETVRLAVRRGLISL